MAEYQGFDRYIFELIAQDLDKETYRNLRMTCKALYIFLPRIAPALIRTAYYGSDIPRVQMDIKLARQIFAGVALVGKKTRPVQDKLIYRVPFPDPWTDHWYAELRAFHCWRHQSSGCSICPICFRHNIRIHYEKTYVTADNRIIYTRSNYAMACPDYKFGEDPVHVCKKCSCKKLCLCGEKNCQYRVVKQFTSTLRRCIEVDVKSVHK